MEQEPPKIEFPCDYPVKVMGVSGPQFDVTVLEIFERHAPGVDHSRISIKASRKGTFTSNSKLLILLKARIVIPEEHEPSPFSLGR